MGSELISSEAEISVGPFGGSTGEPFSYRSKNGIRKIIITHSDHTIESIMFKGDSNCGTTADYSNRFGGGYNRETRTEKIDIDFPSDFLTGMSGTIGGQDNWTVVKSLKVYTKVTKYGPFGKEEGSPFSFCPSGGVITGFFGSSGGLVDSIGFYMRPICSVFTMVTQAMSSEFLRIWDQKLLDGNNNSRALDRIPGPWGGEGGRAFDDGVFCDIRQLNVHICGKSNAVSALQFQYVKKNGTTVWSPMHGSPGGEIVKKVLLKTGEFVCGVEGFYGRIEGIVGGMSVITSLTFITNVGKYDPLGVQIGKFFKSSDAGKVVGFFGRSGEYVDAIGVHVDYDI